MKTEGQSKFQSLLESLTNILIGIGIAILGQLVVFPMYGFTPELEVNLKIAGWFTLISLVRSYVLRRGFNWIMLNWRKQ